ncbi:MAG: glycosyltransferase family 2 protein [Planctomycetes bacterium]|nr:glycosyltransferase family 2 protein [Planctomycetota bacterium]
MPDSSLRLSVVIPAYNEEARIGRTLDRVLDYLEATRRGSYEVLVVDDGSRDRTCAEVAARGGRGAIRLLTNGANRGKGYSVRHGMLAAAGASRLMSDADLSTPIEELERLETCRAAGCDVAIASRALAGSDVQLHQPWWRETMGKSFNVFVRLLALRGIYDTQCGFKLFSAPAAEAIFRRLTFEGFSFDVEALFLARRLGFRVGEVAVRWIDSPASKVHPVRDASRMLLDLVRLRLRDLDGGYRGRLPRVDAAAVGRPPGGAP